MVVTFVIMLSLLGCSSAESSGIESNKQEEKPTGTFIEIDRGVSWKVVFHRDTKVMYVVSNNFTLLVNADGTPMLYGG